MNGLNAQVLRLVKLYYCYEMNNIDWTVWIHKHSAYSNCIIHLKSMRQIGHFEHMCIQSIQTVWLHWNESQRLNTLNTCSFRVFNLYHRLEINETNWTHWIPVHSGFSNCIITLNWMTQIKHLVNTMKTCLFKLFNLHHWIYINEMDCTLWISLHSA